jgi:hypothetical protein
MRAQPATDLESLKPSSPAHTYLSSLAEIPGWFAIEDFIMFEGINEVQREQGVEGDLLEIGVYQGKSAILLGSFRNEDEELVVCDLFGSHPLSSENASENLHHYPKLTRLAFESNYRRFHERMPRVLQCSSEEIPNRGLSRSFRFAHIDGSHLYEGVRADLKTVRELMLPNGIVALDDYRHPRFPGTAQAIWEEIITGHLTPICLTYTKMFAAWKPSDLADRLVSWCAQSPLLETELLEGAVAGRRLLSVTRSDALVALARETGWLPFLPAEPRPPKIGTAKRIVVSLLPPALTSFVSHSRRRLRRMMRDRSRQSPSQ